MDESDESGETRQETRDELRPHGLRALRRRGIYLLPNLFTTAALFFGFFAIVQAMNNRFEASAIAVFIAMVLDGLDGRVARLTHTQSEFGAQYDSLSDMVSFGAAPALLRARLHTNLDVIDKRSSQGRPSPMAAALLAGLVWVFDDLGIDREL